MPPCDIEGGRDCVAREGASPGEGAAFVMTLLRAIGGGRPDYRDAEDGTDRPAPRHK